MCMGYAKDIKAWACPQEIGRRDEALRQWGDLLLGPDASDPRSPLCAADANSPHLNWRIAPRSPGFDQSA
ncbi:MAG TPA: hypothetical protein VFM48_06535 [Aquabacterium sp.]|nr:hypothetical protein [Aquabacterium sp.]